MSTQAATEHRFSTTLIIALLGMIGPFTIDTVFPAFAHIGAEFGSSDVALQQLTSVYLFSFAVMSLFHGPISDAVGRKPVMIVGVLLYALAAVGCALSPNLTVLLVFRCLQGVFAGAGQIISRALIRDLFSGAAAQKLMAQVAMIFSIAPAIAPIIGGWLLRFGPWRFIFWALCAFGVLLAVLVATRMPETLDPADRVPVRVGSILSGLREVFSSFAFVRLALVAAFSFGAQFLYIASAPIIVVNLFGKGDQDFWMLFVPMIAGVTLGSLINARMAGRIDMTRLASFGYGLGLVAAATNVALALAAPSSPLPWAVIGPFLIALSASISFPVIQLFMLDLFPHRRGSAASAQAFCSLIFNALLAGVVSSVVTGSLLTLALCSAAFTVIGVLFWAWHLHSRRAQAQQKGTLGR